MDGKDKKIKKELEKLSEVKSLPENVRESIKQKQEYVNKPFKK